jgi:hypothetical protein
LLQARGPSCELPRKLQSTRDRDDHGLDTVADGNSTSPSSSFSSSISIVASLFRQRRRTRRRALIATIPFLRSSALSLKRFALMDASEQGGKIVFLSVGIGHVVLLPIPHYVRAMSLAA